MKIDNYEIKPSTTGVTATDGAGATWNADNWDLLAPANIWYILGGWSALSAYLVGDDAAEMPAATKIRLIKRDVRNEQTAVLWQGLYAQIKELRGRKKLMTLDGFLKMDVTVGPTEHLIFMANGADAAGTGDLDVSASFFKLKARRRFPGLS